MAGSRLEKLGTVFSRTRDLMRAGVIKQKEKPIWYDVYATFPPKREPTYEKPLNRRNKLPDNVTAILYSEDVIRAKFYETYGSTGLFHLYRKNFKSVCQRYGPWKATCELALIFHVARDRFIYSEKYKIFVETYMQLQKAGEVSEDNLFEETSKTLLAEGIILRRAGMSGVSVRQSSVPESQPDSTVKSATEETS